MSKYGIVETEFRDKAHLVAALKDCGLDAEVHADGAMAHGYAGRREKAHIIVRRQGGMLADIAFRREADDRYTQIVDDYDERYVAGLKQKYQTHRTIAQARAKGYRLIGQETTATGKVQLRFAVR